MSTEPIGTHQRGKPLPAESLQRLKKWFARTRNICESARGSGVSRNTAYKYLLRPQQDIGLSDLDI